MQLNVISFGGWDHCLELKNDTVRLVITTDIGPRVVFYGFNGGQNLFHLFPDDAGKTGGETWRNYGGHRLWYAPERAPRTYYPDNVTVPYRWDGKILTLLCPDETSRGVGKRITVELAETGSRVDLTHTLTNIGMWPLTLSIWTLTVMAEEGTLVIPQEPYVPHGSGPGESFAPARPLVLWPYTDMSDPRFQWGKTTVSMRQDNRYPSKQKIGMFNTLGWAHYELNGERFTKHFSCEKAAEYPDFGCNCEFFTMPGFTEIEALSPLLHLKEGESASASEFWTLEKI